MLVTAHLSRPTRQPITLAPVFAIGNKPITKLPPEELVEQLVRTYTNQTYHKYKNQI